MPLALFDLDNTLLGGDSDHAWGDWLCEQNILDSTRYKARNDAFFHDYQSGRLDVNDYLAFCMEILGRTEMAQLDRWHLQFMKDRIEPIILPQAEALLQRHREAGDRLVIITATHRFITEPIAQRLGVDNLIATECEIQDGRYTGRPTGTPCFREGKVIRLERWLQDNQLDLTGSHFYSDSINDLYLLERVEHPVAVDPDPKLRAEAEKRGWSVISLRTP